MTICDSAGSGRKRAFLLRCVPWLAVYALGSCGSLDRVRPPLNVVLITLDTTRADALGTYGGRGVTPTLDHLGSTGVVFEQASTVAPLTLPAHSSLVTGLLPPGHHVHENGDAPLASRFLTLAERLKTSGFETGAFVSSFVLDHRWGLDQGFDVYREPETRPGPIDRESLRRPADRVVDDALGWLQQVGGRRFFAWLHFYDAHAPAEPPADFASPHGQDSYHGAIGFIDFQLSRVMAFLDERGMLDRTIVVVVGDHGESLGEHGEASHGLFVYQSVIHVPLLIRAPTAAMQGRRVADPVRIVDVMPTVLDLLGEADLSAADGQTLAPLMRGDVQTLSLEAYAESRYGFDRFGWSPLVSLRQGRFKLILAPRPELYDLTSDPHERINLYREQARLAAELTRRLQTFEQPSESQQVAEGSRLDADTRARLAALGYVAASTSRPVTETVAPLADPKDRVELYRRLTQSRQGPSERLP